jgi:hypothetical protein
MERHPSAEVTADGHLTPRARVAQDGGLVGTPSRASRVTTMLWELADMAEMLEDWEASKDA